MIGLSLQEIIEMEWKMFRQVNGDAHVSCQENRDVFTGMRTAQLSAWLPEVADSYLEDLRRAEKNGRNLLREKYINMMASTSPEEYVILARGLDKPSPAMLELVDRLSSLLMEQTAELHEKYPNIARSGRPRSSSEDGENQTSIETYQRSELLTYSERTVELLLEQAQGMALNGESLPQRILENIIHFYGYSDLETAESAAAKRAGSRSR